MDAILKKCKITQSILSQSLITSFKQLSENKILGWCVFKGDKYIVCYDEELNSLSKCLSIKRVYIPVEDVSDDDSEEDINQETKKYQANIIYDNGRTYILKSKTEDDLNFVINAVNRAIELSSKAGQFYL